EHICESLEIFSKEVMDEFKEKEDERERKKAEELAPYIEAALARKEKMCELADEEIPVFPALGRRITEESANEPSIYERPTAAAD
ncbi:MAG: hypothetical protein P8Y95_06350, partial [Gammaproteobacteria bacterium]